MKTILLTIFLLVNFICRSQIVDAIWVPNEKTLVGSYNGVSPIGFYFAGYYRTTTTNGFIYTTPMSVINRVGLTCINKKNQFSFMGGVRIKNNLNQKPILIHDLWLKIYPLRIFTKTSKGPDLCFAINQSETTNFGIGLSLGIRGIYR